VLSADVYGGTYRVAARLFEGWGRRVSVVDMTNLDQLKQAIRSETRLVWVETPTNPLLGVVDIAGAAELAHAAGALCAVDNTFATPFLQRPLELGADLVVHSSTKYLGGHSDVVRGGLCCSCAPGRSTWAATQTCAAGPWSRTCPSCTSGPGSSRTRSGPCPGR